MLGWSEFCLLLIFYVDINTITMIIPFQNEAIFLRKNLKILKGGKPNVCFAFHLPQLINLVISQAVPGVSMVMMSP